jgi:flagellar biosynthesis GTPase FlhF
MTSALRLIKRELGPDAVILSARNLKKENRLLGLIKSVGVEVTAAVDTFDLPVKTDSSAFKDAVGAYRPYGPAHKPAVRSPGRIAGERIQSQTTSHKPLIGCKDNIRFAADGVLGDLFQHLLAHEVKHDLACKIVAHLNQRYAHSRFDSIEPVMNDIANLLQPKCTTDSARSTNQTGVRIISIVGPSGAGKTTTIAKLAARHAIEQHQKVALISLDADRIGAAAELKIYARAMGLPLKMAATPAESATVVNEFRHFDFILVDTPGLNPFSTTEIDALKGRLDNMGSVEIHLALSALTKDSDLGNVVRRLNVLALEGVIFTKLDESCSFGSLINLLWDHPLPLSYVTDGRQVPDAIHTGSVKKILKRLLADYKLRTNDSNKDASLADMKADSSKASFVANRNSDLFHCSDCKWTRKIKPKNLITFSTADAAQRQQFIPCRDCQPHKSQTSQTNVSATRDSVRILNYS